MIDFTNMPFDYKGSNYGGSDRKRGIIYDGKRYMVKVSDRIETDTRNPLKDSYSNSVYSEYVCCHILQICGYDAQNTILGQMIMDTKKHKDMIMPAVACENFIPEGYTLMEFKHMQNALSENAPGRIPKITEIYELLGNENAMFSKEFSEKALKQYWETFIFDAYFGNFDRHGNNWGYLISEIGEAKLAPIYDCGSCLYPRISDEAIPGILNNPEAIRQRIDVFPKAALELEDKTKVQYRNFINSLENKECTEALLKVYPIIQSKQKQINNFIDGVEGISDIRKEFYKTMLPERKTLILESAYYKAIALGYETEIENDTDAEYDEDSLVSDDMLEKYNNILQDSVSEKSQYNKVKSQYDIEK